MCLSVYMSTKGDFLFLNIYQKIVHPSFDILGRKCVGNSKVVPIFFYIKEKKYRKMYFHRNANRFWRLYHTHHAFEYDKRNVIYHQRPQYSWQHHWFDTASLAFTREIAPIYNPKPCLQFLHSGLISFDSRDKHFEFWTIEIALNLLSYWWFRSKQGKILMFYNIRNKHRRGNRFLSQNQFLGHSLFSLGKNLKYTF